MTTPSKHSHSSFSLPLLGATTTIGFWLVWRRFHKGNKIFPSIDSVTPFKFEPCKPENSRQTSINQDKDSQLDNSQSSILNEEEVEQVWTDNGDVDLKILKQLIQHKEEKLDRQKPKPGSKLTLFSHLVTRLEQTLEERRRVQAKLGQFRRLPEAEGRIRGNDDTVNNKTSKTSVCMVVQRFRSATLLINEDNAVRVGATTTSSFDDEESPKDKCCGMLVYVSFAKGATQAMVQAAGKIIVNLPILTFGAWGDGVSKNMNVLDLAVHQQNAASLVIVPQANLTCRVCTVIKGKLNDEGFCWSLLVDACYSNIVCLWALVSQLSPFSTHITAGKESRQIHSIPWSNRQK